MKLKKLFAIILSTILMFCVFPTDAFNFAASAVTSSTTGDCTWTLDGTVLTISGNGKMGDYDSSSYSRPWGLSITEVIIEDGVTTIGECAFYKCSKLTNVTIPNSIISIEKNAFNECNMLTSIIIPNGVTSIGSGAFWCCSSLTDIIIPNSVTSILSYAFSGCSSLTSITLPFIGSSRTADAAPNKNLGYIFSYDKINTNWDYYYTYYVPSSLKSVTITDITQVPDHAFSGCESITNITLCDGITDIGDGAFAHCRSLSSITIPNSVTSIGDSAFYNCTSLTDITVPESVTSIGGQAFYNCTGLSNVVIPANVTNFESGIFSGCTNLTSATISEGLTSVASSTFSGCSSLESVKLPVSVTKINSSAFNGCTNLTNVYYGGDKIDRGIITIGDYNTPLTDATWHYNYCEHIYSSSVVTPPTCTTQGYTTYTCEKCGDVYDSDYVSALGHSYGDWRVIVPADCENSGSHTRICNVCGNIENAVIPALGHNYIENVIAPTCTEDGYTKHICLNCNDSYTDNYVDAIGHNYASTVVEPTCTEQGYTEWICLNCGDNYKENYIDALGHNFGEWITDNQPTCTSEGSRYRVCDVCEFTEYEELSVLQHNYSAEWTIDAQPDCVKNGSKSRHCVDCGAKTDITVISAYGHAFDSWKYESVPTCTVSGKIVCSCLLCGEKKTITIEPYGHDFSSEWTVDTEPTCIETGVQSNHCTRCEVTNNETELPALGHSYTAVTKVPTCTEQGYTEHICTACGDFYKTDIVDANGHFFTHYEQKVATCTENGYEAYDECNVCGYTTYKEIIASGHDYQLSGNGYVCTYCGNSINVGNIENHTYIKTIVKATEEQNGYTQYTCTDCGYYYRADFTEYITASKISISDSIVGAGKTFILTVSLSNNPGIYSFTLGVDYDMDNLTLTEVKDLKTLGGEISSSKNKILWLNNTREDSVYNGAILQLVFTASPYAVAQDYSISISYNAGNIINYSLEDVSLAVESGVITVENFTAGDLNGDSVVNNKDLVLMSEIFARNYTAYIHGKEHIDKHKDKKFNLFGKYGVNELKDRDIVVLGVIIERAALDCNNDGVINNHDLLTMMKYLRGEEITIK